MKKLSLVLMLVFASFTALVAQRSISGSVTDENGEGLIGATILVKGTSTGAVTDIDGNYNIDVPAGSDVLVFSYTGYGTQEVSLGASNVLDVTMAPDATLLNEVIVTGYSEVQAKKLVSSVSVVGKEAIENVPLTNINGLIQGRAPGVYTTANSGQPGSTQAIRIRGTGSITGSRGPLYVLDGIIIETGNVAGQDGAQAADILANLNPNDIENVTVLKDAAATSLYGSRGSNGVILITTKRGKVGKTDVTVKAQYGTTEPLDGNFEIMSAQQQWDYERQVLANSGFSAEQIDGIRPASQLDNTTDWVDAAFQTGNTYNIEAQARGGNEKTRFFASAGYFEQQGTVIESDFNRTSFRANVDHSASDKLDFGLNLNATYSQQLNSVSGNRFQSPILGAFLNTPLQGATDPTTGELYTGLEPDWLPFVTDNFLYSQPLNYVDINTFRLLSKLSIGYNILKNLRFTQSANIDWLTLDEADWNDPTTNDGENLGGSLDRQFSNRRTITTQSKLSYYTTLADDHNLDLFAVFEYQRNRSDGFGASGAGFASGRLQTLNSAAEANGVPFGSISNYAFVSVLGQANYNFQEKYYLTASLRRDGSSRFGENNRYATFWSVGASWLLSQENFIAKSNLISDLKFRVSYGTSGNAGIGNFPSLQLYGFGAAYNNQPGSNPSQIGNPDLQWERSNQLDIGIDFGFFDNRLGGSIDYYIKRSEDLLLNVPVSSTAGFTSATQNLGELENTGVEISLFGTPIKSNRAGGFNWDLDFNISFNDNQITSLPNGEDINNGSQIWREGTPIRAFFIQDYVGADPQTGTPLWNRDITDANGNVTGVETTGSYNQATRYVIGNAAPDWTAGLNTTFSFEGITLSAFFYTAQGHELLNSSRRFIESDGQRFGWNHIVPAADAWSQPGDIAVRPQPLVGGNNNANATSTRYLEDASFIRLRNVTLGYSLPKSITDKLNVGRVSIYAQGVNLWTQTDYSGFDPEADEDGVEFFRYPVGKSITFGLDVTF